MVRASKVLLAETISGAELYICVLSQHQIKQICVEFSFRMDLQQIAEHYSLRKHESHTDIAYAQRMMEVSRKKKIFQRAIRLLLMGMTKDGAFRDASWFSVTNSIPSSDKLVAAAVGTKSHGGVTYSTTSQTLTGLMPAGSAGVNHGMHDVYKLSVS